VLNLIIDIGNTRTKIALFDQCKMIVNFPVDLFSANDFYALKSNYPTIGNAIISSVKESPNELIKALKQGLRFVVVLDHNTLIPIENCYKTPETLGKDRLAAAVGANKIYPNQNLLVIDAGTAITYDFVNEQNQYTGGFITPGLTMRFNALNYFTNKLPLLKPELPRNYEGNNTETSIRGGIQYGLQGEIDYIYNHLNPNKKELIIILTGGDTNYFEKLLKKYKFVSLEITLLGLNTILEFNHINNLY